MRFTLVILSLFMCGLVYGQFEECPCDPTAIDCPCPNPPVYVTPTVTPPPAPIPQCGDISNYPTSGNFDPADFTSGYEDGRDQTLEFVRLSLAMCEYRFIGGNIGSVLGAYVVPNPQWVVEPSGPQVTSIPGFNPYVRENAEFVIASPGHDPSCTGSLNSYLIQLSGIIADKINQETASPGSTGFSLVYWLGFCSGFGLSAGSW